MTSRSPQVRWITQSKLKPLGITRLCPWCVVRFMITVYERRRFAHCGFLRWISSRILVDWFMVLGPAVQHVEVYFLVGWSERRALHACRSNSWELAGYVFRQVMNQVVCIYTWSQATRNMASVYPIPLDYPVQECYRSSITRKQGLWCYIAETRRLL